MDTGSGKAPTYHKLLKLVQLWLTQLKVATATIRCWQGTVCRAEARAGALDGLLQPSADTLGHTRMLLLTQLLDVVVQAAASLAQAVLQRQVGLVARAHGGPAHIHDGGRQVQCTRTLASVLCT